MLYNICVSGIVIYDSIKIQKTEKRAGLGPICTRRFSALGEFANSRDSSPLHVNSREFCMSHVNSFLSGQICPPVHIIYALFIYLFLRTKINISISKNISHIHAICPVTSERYSEVTGHLPGDRQTNADAIIFSDHFSSLHHQPPAPITHRTIILTLLPSIHRPGFVRTVSS